MNWLQLKQAIEQQGVTDETAVGEIDLSYPIIEELTVRLSSMKPDGSMPIFSLYDRGTERQR